MRNGDADKASPVERLRTAIDCMPIATREAMLAGVRANERIIAGAYVDGEGGVCPMLAAHRCGGRTDFLSFAKLVGPLHARGAATRGRRRERELRILMAQLEASVMSASGLELDVAISGAPRAGQPRARAGAAAPGAADPSGEITAQALRRPSVGDFWETVARDAPRAPAPVSALG